MSTTGLVTIDLGAIADNWRYLSLKVGEACVCGAVVKANAYGLGVQQVASSLFAAGCRVFFVATLAEAIALRGYLGSDSEIIVFGGLAHDSHNETCRHEWLEYKLTPVLFSLSDIRRWLSFAKEHSSPLPCALKIDTGMHRLGVQPEELESLISSNEYQQLSPRYVMSHFACADEPEHPLNAQQIERFTTCVEKIGAQQAPVKLSLCNSSGIFLDDDIHFDLVRPGIALYGGNPTPGLPNSMKPVVSLHLPVMQLKWIAPGESVGYGGEFVAQRRTRLAIAFGGYADGLHRALLGRASAFLGGEPVVLAGRVSMDSLVFDVTDVSDAVLSSSSTIELIGEHQSLDQLAGMAGTISYEVLTSIGSRYERQYINSNSGLVD